MPGVRNPQSVHGIVIGCLLASGVAAQQPSAEDQAIDAMRGLPQIGTSDQRRISEWLEIQIGKVSNAPKETRSAAANVFRASLKAQFANANDSPAFRTQLRAQLAQVAATKLAGDKPDRWVGFAIARTLVDFNGLESLPGFFAGLKSPEELVRYLSAEGLAGLGTALAADKEKFDQTVAALKEAGQVETSPVVLGRIYAALANPTQVGAVFDAYMAIFEKRLAAKRAATGAGDGGELEAYEYFRNSAVQSALTPDQKNRLVAVVATFLRFDAARYDSQGLKFDEIDRVERRLDAEESILSDIVGGGKGGAIRDELAANGYTASGKVTAEATKWVGNKDAKGTLNDPPYNLPAGAP